MRTTPFTFSCRSRTLVGICDFPDSAKPKGIVVLVHGDGRTDVVKGDWYLPLRRLFTELGYASCAWDKPGCGKSGGSYRQQSVRESAEEALCAIRELRESAVPGSGRIGLWGISRAGWVCPSVIDRDGSIAFWISVSGTSEEESFAYLLERNLDQCGVPRSERALLVNEWIGATKCFLSGGKAKEYIRLSRGIRRNAFYRGHFGPTSTIVIFLLYKLYQKRYLKQPRLFDAKTNLEIYVPDMAGILKAISCPVLAIFGDRDTRVDWRRTSSLYKDSIKSPLRIIVLENVNHGMQVCDTGSISEERLLTKTSDEYYRAIESWMKDALHG
jgi:uncharacterized protein